MSRGILYNALKAVRPLRVAVRWVRGVWEHFRPDAWVLEGAERTSGEPIRVLFVGQIENCNYVARVVFADGAVDPLRRRMWSWQVNALLKGKQTKYGMIFVQHPPGVDIGNLRQPCYVLPSWLAGELDVAQSLASHRGNESVKTDLRNIRRNGFTYRVTNDPSDLDRFYTEMYLPYVRQTHGDRAFVASRDELDRESRGKPELLLIEREGVAVAGVCLGIHGSDRVDALELGVVGADRNLVRMGALASIYYYSLKHAADRHCSRLYLGGSRPFLHDGALQYKKKWGLHIVGRLHSLPDVLVFQPRPDTVAVRSFLLNNPFVYEDSGAFRAAVFVSEQDSAFSESIEKLRKTYCLSGLAGIAVFRMRPTAGFALDGIGEPTTAPQSVSQ